MGSKSYKQPIRRDKIIKRGCTSIGGERMYKYVMILMVVATVIGLVITKNIADNLREDTVLEKRAPIAVVQSPKKTSSSRVSVATRSPVFFYR